MKSFQYTIKDPAGLHTRPVGKIVNEIKKYSSQVIIKITEDKFADARKLLEIMKLNIKSNTEINIIVNGSDEDMVVQNLKLFFEENKF